MIQLVAIAFHIHTCAAYTHLQRSNMSWYLTRSPEKSIVHPRINNSYMVYDTSCSYSAFHFHICAHIDLQTSNMSRRICALHLLPIKKLCCIALCQRQTPKKKRRQNCTQKMQISQMSKKVQECWDDEGASLILQLPKQEKRYVFVS